MLVRLLPRRGHSSKRVSTVLGPKGTRTRQTIAKQALMEFAKESIVSKRVPHAGYQLPSARERIDGRCGAPLVKFVEVRTERIWMNPADGIEPASGIGATDSSVSACENQHDPRAANA